MAAYSELSEACINQMAAGSMVHHATFQTYFPELYRPYRTWCPTDLQHLCCRALINE